MENIYQKRVEKSQREVYVGNIPFSVRKLRLCGFCQPKARTAGYQSAERQCVEGRRIIVRSAYTSRVSSHECTTFETKVKELRVKEESNGCSACSCKEAMGGRRLFARHDVEMVSDQEDENQFGLKTAVKKEKLEEQKMLLEIKKFEIEIQKLQLEIRKL